MRHKDALFFRDARPCIGNGRTRRAFRSRRRLSGAHDYRPNVQRARERRTTATTAADCVDRHRLRGRLRRRRLSGRHGGTGPADRAHNAASADHPADWQAGIGLGWIVGLAGGRVELAASRLSVVRTIVDCAVALALGYMGSRWGRVELGWVAYAAVGFGTLKLLFEDL